MTWGAVASIGVGLLTSKGSKGSSTTQQQMDPAMRPYIFGDDKQKGLLQYNADQLARSQSPERQQMWNNLMTRGQELMGGSVAGNPFSQGYTGGTYFGQNGMSGNGLGRFAPPPVAAPQPVQQQQQPAPLTMEEIMAEFRRQQGAVPVSYFGGDGPSNGSSGDF